MTIKLDRTTFWRTWPLAAAIAATLALAGCSDSSTTVSAASESPSTSTPDDTAKSTGCGDKMDDQLFANVAQLKALVSKPPSFGLRSPGSDADNRNVAWLESELRKLPGMQIRSQYFDIKRWQPTPLAADGVSRDLEAAGKLSITPSGPNASQSSVSLPVAGAVPYSLSTGNSGKSGALVYLPTGTAISAANSKGKMLIRDYPSSPLPYATFLALADYLTADLLPLMTSNYDRPYIAAAKQVEDLIAAGRAGAAGVIFVFNVPRAQVAAYWDPHDGTHFIVPSIMVGVDEGEQLKKLASSGGTANIAVLGERDVAPTRNLFATLPGKSPERIIINANTDGNTWVQEDAVGGMLALANYFAHRPIECRPRTIEFAFGASHLAYSKDGTGLYAKELDKDYDKGTVAFAFAIEHMGTREILPMARTDGPGQILKFTGESEPMAWFAGESPALAAASIAAVQQRGLDRIAILRGQDIPNPARVPMNCSFGGIGGFFHSYLIPTLAIISGPWSLWAPSFGESAIDFDRLHSQLLAVGDVILALDDLPREVIAGAYPLERQLRAAGVPTCPTALPPEEAPGPDAA